jgi:hypothetical protein
MTNFKNLASFAIQAALGTAFIASTSIVGAQMAAPSFTPKIDAREKRQDARIDQGVASGQLTTKEAAKLDARQTRIQQLEASAKADGNVTKAERSQIRQAQDNASKAIYRQKHDKQVDLNHDGKRDRPLK